MNLDELRKSAEQARGILDDAVDESNFEMSNNLLLVSIATSLSVLAQLEVARARAFKANFENMGFRMAPLNTDDSVVNQKYKADGSHL